MNTTYMTTYTICFLLEIFNTRELANLIWVLIGISIAMFMPSTRRPFLEIIKHLFIWKFILIYIVAFTYIGFILMQLERLDLWNLSLLKDTIYWGILSGTVLMYKVSQSKEPLAFVKAILVSSVQFAVFIEFIANLETFNFWLEFMTIPIIILFAGMYVVAQYRKEHASVRNLLGRLGNILSIIAFGYVIYFAVTNFEKYSNIETIKQFLLPIILTLSFTPILCILNLVVQYEDISLSLKRHSKSKREYYYMVATALLYFNFNIKGLIRWQQSLWTLDLMDNREIKASMKQVRIEQKREKISPEYPELEGWLPKYAKSFLTHCGLDISDYDSDLGKIWIGGSAKLKLEGDYMTADCEYTINGTMHVVKHLKLHFQMFDPSRRTDLQKFINIANELYRSSLYEDMPHKIRTSILELKKIDYKNEFADVSLKIHKWQNEMRGYDLYMDIRRREDKRVKR